ncbi:MAG: hypothetical protein IPK81_20360 [Rhodospirillales bacterium]|nr:MAG: hypothetical protein IPK81_20360 [Rhodospirillales bacterium]
MLRIPPRAFTASALLGALALSTSASARESAADCVARIEVGPGAGTSPGPVVDVAWRCRAPGDAREVRFIAGHAATAAALGDIKDAGGTTVPRDGDAWIVSVVDGVATLRYRLDVGALARGVDSVASAVARGGGVAAVASTWLLEPRLPGVAVPALDLAIATAPGHVFAAGLPETAGVWRVRGQTLRFVGYTALGRVALQRVPVPSPATSAGRPAHIDLAILDGALAVTPAELALWTRRTAEMTAGYWGGFTVERMLLVALPTAGRRGIGYGRTVPGAGMTVIVQVGSASTPANLQDDWVLPHEFVHSGMPFLRGAAWLMEGAATYVEPITRARAGWRTEASVWREWIDSMPRGLAALDAGLAGGSPYWGGALFLLLTDIEIRRATSGAKGIEDCLRGARDRGGVLAPTERWPLAAYVEACDAALGAPVMAGMVARHLGASRRVDLAALWRDLGVRADGDGVAFDDTAPLAAIRLSIVMGPPDRKPVAVPPLVR